MTFVELVSQYG